MQIEHTLRAAFAARTPGMDFEDAVMRRVTAASWRASRGPRKPSRVILFGTILAVAAAAAALVSQLISSSAQVTAELPAAPTVVDAAPVEPATVLPVETAEPPPAAAGDAAAVVAAVPVPPVAPSFTVQVQPLQLNTKVLAVESRVRAYFNALIDELRLVPGLVLVPAGATNAAEAVQPDFRITVTGGEMGSEFMQGVASWQVSLRTEAWQDEAWQNLQRGSMGSGGTLDAGACPQAAVSRSCGPGRDAARAVAGLLRVFPPSPALEELRARYRAESQVPQQDSAIAVNAAVQPGAVPTMDAETIRLVLARIAEVPEPGPRAAMWLTLRGQQYPEKLSTLLKALREERADVVRKELITQLALDFADEPAAREPLAAVAAVEPQPLARHVAERALFGDVSWRAYVAASLRDTSLPAAQRLDPLTWMLDARQRYPQVDATFKEAMPALLAGDGARVLADLLARRQEESDDPLEAEAVGLVIARIGTLDDAGVPHLLLAWFDAVPTEDALRLLSAHRDDPRVQQKLQAIVAGNPDPKLRQQAASYLRQAPR